MDYSSDKEDSNSLGSSKDNNDKKSDGDNSPHSEQGDKREAEHDNKEGALETGSFHLQEIRTLVKKPVLTQQAVMNLVEIQASSKRTASTAGWERRKEEFSQLLDGYESPKSRTVQVDVGLATLMIISAVAENANKINLEAQQQARESMIRQAELHRENLEKEFNSGLARIRLEHDKAISEAQKFRKECTRSCTIDNGEKNMQGIGDNQLMALMTFQMNVLLKKA